MNATTRGSLASCALLFACVACGSGGNATADPDRAASPRAAPARLAAPRIPPVEKAEWTEAQRAYLEPYERAGMLFNVFATAAHHPELARSFDAFAVGYLGGEAYTLPPRHKELLILRIGWLSGAEYEWAQHARIARSIGFSEEELVRITCGPDAPGWTRFEATLLRAVDELDGDAFISDSTWAGLAEAYDERQLMDLVFTVGTYGLVSMVLNTLGVQLDEGLARFPARACGSR